jgi:hypothetical protein
MHDRLCASNLVPCGFVVDEAVMDGTTAVVTLPLLGV